MNKWFSTGYQISKPEGAVDREKGVISGALVVTEGEAKGHDVFLDAGFVDEVIRQGNESKSGVKARFGHPNMCSTALGTFIGRWKNFRREAITRSDGSAAIAARADLFLSSSAKDTPNGDLYAYVLKMAEQDGDMFGSSIVFSAGESFRYTAAKKKVKCVNGMWIGEDGLPHDPEDDPIEEREYVELEKLHACDVVDDPAANDGLFSRFSTETLAGQITEFLDLHPQVWAAINDNPSVIEAIAQHGEQADQFLNRYRTYREQNHKQETPMNNEADASVATPDAEVPAPEAQPIEAPADAVAVVVTPVNDAPVGEPETAVQQEAAKPEPQPVVVVEPVTATESKPDARDEFKRMKADFGAELAAEVFAEGLGYAECKDRHFARIADENKRLKEMLANEARASGSPAAFIANPGESKVINGVHRAFINGTRGKR